MCQNWARARPVTVIINIASKIKFCLGSFRLASLNELCIPGSSSGSITQRALFQAWAWAH
ncbi:hypothetical protein HanIR_Chr09g0401571 [Helianthus annuus]|nr:hypothetical protein HanIR_Chr09g0401571 [Helianthus annuus]